MTEPPAAPEEPAPPRPSEGGALDWRRVEVAWALALAAGFGGTLGGVLAGVPGVAALLATGLLAPLHLALLRAGRAGTALAAAAAWGIGVLLGVVAAAESAELGRVLDALPFAAGVLEAETRALVDGAEGGGGLAARRALLALAAVLLARPLAGLGGLAATALLLGTLGASAAWTVARAVPSGADLLVAAAAGLPPHGVLQAAGCLTLAVAAGAPGPLLPPSQERGRRLAAGAALLAAGLVSEPWAAPWWGGWLGRWLG